MRIISYNLLKEHWRGDFEKIEPKSLEAAASFVYRTYLDELIPLAQIVMATIVRLNKKDEAERKGKPLGRVKISDIPSAKEANNWLIRRIFNAHDEGLRRSGLGLSFELDGLFMIVNYGNEETNKEMEKIKKMAGITEDLPSMLVRNITDATVRVIKDMPTQVGWFVTHIEPVSGADAMKEGFHQKIVRAFYEWHHDEKRLRKDVQTKLTPLILKRRGGNMGVALGAEAYVAEDRATVGEEVPKESRERWGMRDKKLEHLYHATPFVNWKEIKATGIKPKSAGRVAAHPPRVYLVADADKALEIGSALQDKEVVFLTQNPEAAKKIGITGPRDYAIVEIDVDELPEKFTVYQDPMYSGGFYAYKEIPASAVSMFEIIDTEMYDEEFSEFEEPLEV